MGVFSQTQASSFFLSCHSARWGCQPQWPGFKAQVCCWIGSRGKQVLCATVSSSGLERFLTPQHSVLGRWYRRYGSSLGIDSLVHLSPKHFWPLSYLPFCFVEKKKFFSTSKMSKLVTQAYIPLQLFKAPISAPIFLWASISFSLLTEDPRLQCHHSAL